ncbi:hypothetical protein D3C76_441070 [compost metagenome]
MKTSEPTSRRKLLHTRQITCTGYEREDGLYDIEGHMRDLSADATRLPYRDVEPGGAIHDMHMSMTVDRHLVIQRMEAHIAASPTPFCAEIDGAYAALVGQRIGPGFTQKVKSLFGGASGCTHLSELLGPLATTAYQTLFSVSRSTIGPMPTPTGEGPMAKPGMVDTCHAFRADGEPAKRVWPLERRKPEDQPELIASSS